MKSSSIKAINLYISELIENKDVNYDYKKKYGLDFSLTFHPTIEKRKKIKEAHEFLVKCEKGLLSEEIPQIPPNYRPEISIFLPTFNKEPYLLRAIRSIQNQSFKNYEIIFVDDCLINIKKISKKQTQKTGLVLLLKNYEVLEGIKEENISGEYLFLIKEDNMKKLIEESKKTVKNDYENSISQIKQIGSAITDFDEYTSLRQLTSFSRGFTILVRVTKKSFKREFNSKSSLEDGKGRLFYFYIMDREGTEMQVTCFGKACDYFFNIIEEDNIYEIKDGYVRLNDKKYSSIKNDYKLVLDEKSQVILKEDDERIKRKEMKIVTIRDIQRENLYSIIDFCGVVLDAGEKIQVKTKLGEQNLRHSMIGDITKQKIDFTLWRLHADTEFKEGDILLIKKAKIGEFKTRNIGTMDETSVIVNPSLEIPEVKKLYDFIHSNSYNIKDFEEVPLLKEYENSKESQTETYNTKFIKDVLEALDEKDDIKDIFKISATVTQIVMNDKNYYLGCNDKNCKRKLHLNSQGQYECPNCRSIPEKPTCYYTVSVRVKDASFEHPVDIFGKTAETIMELSADNYRELIEQNDQQKLNEIRKKIEFKAFNFYVKPKLQMYNANSKKKLYAYKIEKFDEAEEAKKLIEYLKFVF